ncbi:MAG: phosphoglycerate kinase [Mycoplasmoidaceae bacterium]
MIYTKKKLNEINVEGKKVILRLDLNVPMSHGQILDDNRIKAALPTIQYLLDKNSKIIILSHLGRIKNNDDKESIDKSLEVVYLNIKKRLASNNVYFNHGTDEKEITKAVDDLKEGEILILENTRFYDVDSKGSVVKLESKNDPKLAKFWASLGDVFVNDAFGTSHRSHASNVGIAKNINESAIGLLVEKELNMLSQASENPEQPLVVILGGAKIADKIKTIEKISKVADKILIGGGMAFTFLKAQGKEVGKSLVDESSIPVAKRFIEELGDKLVLPVDFNCAESIPAQWSLKIKEGMEFPADMIGLDIGKKSIKLFCNEIKQAKTIIWNGPMGVFEDPKFSHGTIKVCKAIYKKTKKGAFTLIGGGDSASAAIKFGFENGFTHISTGGGASLAYLEGTPLPGIEAISNHGDVKPMKIEKEKDANEKIKTSSKKASSSKAKTASKKTDAKVKVDSKKATPAKSSSKPVAKAKTDTKKSTPAKASSSKSASKKPAGKAATSKPKANSKKATPAKAKAKTPAKKK